jgi:demethylmenaquinone methyltransferase/2-methoxy-6-polyprenyl-1,4-benzoquinol methylase
MSNKNNNIDDTEKINILNKDKSYKIFDSIYLNYDFLNKILSFGQDILWRNKLVKIPKKQEKQVFLDLATGTGDILYTFLKKREDVTYAIGLDKSINMLKIAKNKSKKKTLTRQFSFLRGDANQIPTEDGTFDFATMAFGIRNITNPKIALRDIKRVLKSGGKVLILEFSLPPNRFFKFFFLFYLRNIVPLVGRIISGDKYAYKYLNETIKTFPYGESFCKIMEDSGFSNITFKPLTFGIATIYQGDKL